MCPSSLEKMGILSMAMLVYGCVYLHSSFCNHTLLLLWIALLDFPAKTIKG